MPPRKPPLTVARILSWADAHHRRTGEWPGKLSGPVAEAPRETWCKVDLAIRLGPFPAPFQLMVLRSLVGAGLYPRPPPDCMPLPCRCVVPDAFSRDGLTLDRAATMPLPP